MGQQLKNSTTRIGRMAASGNKVAILKLSAILIGVFLVLYYASRLFF
jgi:blocked early in transport 1